jgi:hypothetical protein
MPPFASKRQRRDAIVPVFGLSCRPDEEEILHHRRDGQTLRDQQDTGAGLFLDKGGKMMGHIVEIVRHQQPSLTCRTC